MERWSSLKGIIHADPPDHTALRRLLAKAFTRRVVEQLRPDVERLVDELLDEVAGRDHIDVIAALAGRLPAAVISEMLGVPQEDRVRFMAWSDAALGLQGNERATFEVALKAQEAYVDLQAYFRGLLDDRRAKPRGDGDETDLLTELVRAADTYDGIDEAMLVQSCITLLMGGFETTTSLIANATLILLQRPELLAEARSDDGLMGAVIEETLRYETPIQSITRRVARDVNLDGAQMKEGDLAVIMIGAANRDPRQFDEPDRFDPGRDNRHIAFGFGVHFCIGAPLARLEAPIAVGRLLDRFPDIRLEGIDWNVEKTVLRCPVSLTVSV